MRPPDTLATRLFAVLALVALVAVALTATLAAVLGARDARGDRRDALERQAGIAAAALEGAPQRSMLRVVLLGERRRPGRLRAVRAALADRPPGEGTVRVGDSELLYVRRDTDAGPVAVARRAGRLPGDARSLGSTLLLSGLAGLLLAALAAIPLARRLARPLRRLTAATRPLARGEPHALPPPGGPAELAELRDAFATLADDLERSRATERRFLLSVSHELRTPLTSLRGWSEALVDGQADAAEAGTVLRAEAVRLERLVDDLLALARAGSTDHPVADGPVELGALARAAIARAAPAAAAAGVRLEAEVDEDATAHGDPGRLAQVLANLVDNAVRVTPAGGAVVVRARPGVLEVADTGPGLSPEDRERAFEPLHLHRRLGPERAGRAGLGLALVAELTRAMGGTVAAEQEPGGGARFVVTLRR